MTDSDKLRTDLANERTLLAYIRTALSSWIFGLAAIKLFPDNALIVFLGWGVSICGILVLVWGVIQSRKRHITVNKAQSDPA